MSDDDFNNPAQIIDFGSYLTPMDSAFPINDPAREIPAPTPPPPPAPSTQPLSQAVANALGQSNVAVPASAVTTTTATPLSQLLATVGPYVPWIALGLAGFAVFKLMRD